MMLRRSTRQRTSPDRLKANEWNYRESISFERSARIRNYQRNRCNCGCGKSIDRYNSEIDHIVEISDGGGNERSNLQALHVLCHRIKTKNSAQLRASRRKRSEAFKNFNIDNNSTSLPSHCRYIKNHELTNLPENLLNREVFKKFSGYGMFNGIITDVEEKSGIDNYIITWYDGTMSKMKYNEVVKYIVVWD